MSKHADLLLARVKLRARSNLWRKQVTPPQLIRDYVEGRSRLCSLWADLRAGRMHPSVEYNWDKGLVAEMSSLLGDLAAYRQERRTW